MNKRIDLTHLGGLPVTQYTLAWLQDSYRALFMALAHFIGDKVVVSGMAEIGGQCTNGWLTVSGELVPFVGGVLGTTVYIEETSESRLFFDAQNKSVYFKREAKFGVGAGSFPYADIKRIGTLKDMWYGMAPKGALVYYEGLLAELPAGWEIHELSKGRVIVGFDAADPDFNTMGKDGGVGGAKSVALTANQLPEHEHYSFNNNGDDFTGMSNLTAGNYPVKRMGGGALIGNNNFEYNVVGRGNVPNVGRTSATGGNQAHNNLQPYYVAAIIKKVI